MSDERTAASDQSSSDMSPPSMLCISPFVPYLEAEYAGTLYLVRYLLSMAQLGWKITVAAPNSTENVVGRAAATVRELPISVRLFDSQPSSSVTRNLAIARSGKIIGSPQDWTGSPSLAELAARSDLVDLQFYGAYSDAAWLRSVIGAKPMVAMCHDLMTDAVASTIESTSGLSRLRWRLAKRAIARREASALSACDRFYAFKAADLRTARRLGVAIAGGLSIPTLDVWGNVPPAAPASKRFVFPANFGRTENSEAAEWLVTEVWPRVRHSHPDAQLVFAGSSPPASMHTSERDNIVVTGHLVDFAGAFDDVLAVVSPVYGGGGLKFKVLQAISAGYPIVATAKSLEGIEYYLDELTPEAANGTDAFAEAMIAILDGPQAAIERADQLRQRLDERPDFAARMSDISEEYLELIGRGRGPDA